MSYHIIYPCPQLKDYVSHFWTAAWDETASGQDGIYYVTANSLTEIAFGFTTSELLFSSVQGQTSLHAQYPAGGFLELFGVSLYSYAIPFLFRIPAPELNDRFFSPETLWGSRGKLITEKIAQSSTTKERIAILTDFFISPASRQTTVQSSLIKGVQLVNRSNGNLNISDLASEFCLSQKQFERRFKEQTGFNPKLYARIVRFENAFRNYKRYHNLTEAAYAYGYYDQAHFIRDFKAFAGYSPNRFFRLSGY